MSPRHHVDPAGFVAFPDARVAAIADFENHVLSRLIATVALGRRALVTNDESIAAARWPADLVELGSEHGATEWLRQRHAECHEAAGLARIEAEPVRAKPGGAVGIVGPIRKRAQDTFRQEYARRRRRLSRWSEDRRGGLDRRGGGFSLGRHDRQGGGFTMGRHSWS